MNRRLTVNVHRTVNGGLTVNGRQVTEGMRRGAQLREGFMFGERREERAIPSGRRYRSKSRGYRASEERWNAACKAARRARWDFIDSCILRFIHTDVCDALIEGRPLPVQYEGRRFWFDSKLLARVVETRAETARAYNAYVSNWR